MPKQWHFQQIGEVQKNLGVDVERGLTSKEAKKRLKSHGENKLKEAKRESLISVFISQFTDFMVLVLIGTTVISAVLGEYIDAIAILAIVLLNAILGFVQEYRAEKSLEALKQLTAPVCTVIRDGKQHLVEAADLVPGDVILLEAGDRIPADARVIKAMAFHTNEAPLTGESLPVEKQDHWVAVKDVPLGDQLNMIFMGTLVTRGYATALVVETGMNTEIGKIAGMIHDTLKMETPLQKRLAQLGKWLVLGCLLIVSVVFAVGVWQGFPVYRMFLTGVSLAVAAIPEGLPAVVTIALAVGVQRMIRRNAIIRHLPAVETLGCATVICSDKTGTLTQNKMTVQHYWLAGTDLAIQDGNIHPRELKSHSTLYQALLIGTLCNHAQVEMTRGKLEVIGDPTEGALLAVAHSAGIKREQFGRNYNLCREVPFDSQRKLMSVCFEHQGTYTSYVKGAPDIIVERCTKILTPQGVTSLTPTHKRDITKAMEEMGDKALRVLGLAYTTLRQLPTNDVIMEENLIFTGLVGMMDPPRPEAKKAIRQAKRAGIRTIMVTGDHKKTATAIAYQLGLITSDEAVLTGAEWEKLSFVRQKEVVKTTAVFARVAPDHKLSIVKALKANDEIVAMTGDGVNDAPAVKEADIGISMGSTGTDVTKEASAMVLADDNFQTIVEAIAEGRAIYDNIRKFIRYLLACNVGEVLTMLFATMIDLPLPLLPIQILWVNLVTDGLPAIALGVDPAEDDIMERPPRPPKEGIFARRLHWKIGFTGLLISFCTLAVFVFSLWYTPGDITKAQTLAFTTLVMSQLIFVFQCRSEYHSVFEIGLFGNPYLVLAVLGSISTHLVVLYHPFFQGIFRTVSLTFDDWLLVFIFSVMSLLLDTAGRALRRQLRRSISLLKV